MLNFDIKNMKYDYLDQIVSLEEKVFHIPWSRKSFEDELRNFMSIYYVAIIGTKIIGYAGMWHIVNEGHITNIAVAEEYRRQGVGEALLKKIIRTAEKKEMIGITLEVRMNNEAAQKLYTKHGFKIEGIRKNYYSDTKEDAIIMWRLMHSEGVSV